MSIRETLAELGVRPSKGLGQNFLVHPGAAQRIASAMPPETKTAVEIGPGLGALTESLARSGVDVVAVEIDERLHRYVSGRMADFGPRVRLARSDALDVDWASLLAPTAAPRVLFGNLPYSTSAAMLEMMVRHTALFSHAIFCLQKEVADRIVSRGGRNMGPITVLMHRFCSQREKLFDIPATGFYPKPAIASTVIRLVSRPGVVWTERDRRAPRAIFAARRKKLSSVIPSDALSRAESQFGVSFASRRIDELSVEEAAALADLWHQPLNLASSAESVDRHRIG